MNTTTLLVRKNPLSETELRSTAPLPLATGQVRVQVDCFALTANNITYAAMGEMLQYWQFFPSSEPGWGIVPVWGFGTVQESLHPDVVVGERLYGYWPMASEAVLSPHRTSATGFSDGAAHRAGLHAVYNHYLRCNTDPFYRADNEDIQALLRPRPGSSTIFWPTRTSTVQTHCCCPAHPAKPPTAQRFSWHSAPANR